MRTTAGEHVLFRGHPCWQSMLGFHIKSLILAILAGSVAGVASSKSGGHVQTSWVIGGVLGVFALLAAVGLLRRAATTYTLTDRRLVIEHGMLSREVEEERLDQVLGVAYSQTIRQRLLGMGSVHFDTAAGPDYDLCFWGITQPRELVRTVDRIIARPPVAAGSYRY